MILSYQRINSIFFFLIGTAIGSFLNVLIDRWSNDQPITGRSHCDFCKKQLKLLDLIPVFSFIFLRGRSRCCNKKLSWQYPLVELVTGVMFVFVVIASPALRDVAISLPIGHSVLMGLLRQPTYVSFLAMTLLLGIISCLIVIFFADVKYQIIPDQIQLTLLILGFLLQISKILIVGCNNGSLLNCYIVPLLNIFFSGIVIMAPILLIYLLSRGRGMGFGDVKLTFNMGILLGIKGGLSALYFAFILGGIFGAYLLLSKKKKLKSKIAFGPFLVISCIIMLLFSDKVWQLISSIYSY